MSSVGIYLGEKYSAVAFKDTTVRVIATGPNNEELCRSCVALDRSGNFVVGNAPYKSWKRLAPNIVTSVRCLMGASISDLQVQRMKADKDRYPFGIAKMSGGTDESVVIIMNGKEYTPEQISAEILRQLKNDASVKLGREVTHAVITVPAYFNEKQKTATRKAAELAGLKVQRLLAEPIAAAISYGAYKMTADEDKIFLVYDFGARAFDLSIIIASGGNYIESGTGGDKWLGGDDIDRLISEYVITEAGKANNVDLHKILESLPDKKKFAFQGEFKNEIESAKKALIQSESASISIFDQIEDEDGNTIDIDVTLKSDKFESMIRPLVQRTLDLIDELLERTAYPIDTIDNILLVGGTSVPLIRKMLCDKYGKDKILTSEKPMLAIAEGAAILSHFLGAVVDRPDCGKVISAGTSEFPYSNKTLDVIQQVPSEDKIIQCSYTTRHKLFIHISEEGNNEQYELIIDENTPLPCKEIRTFKINKPNQSITSYKLFTDGESSKELLGTVFFLVEKGFPVNEKLKLSFNLNEDETLMVHASIENIKRPVKVILGRGALDSHCCAFLLKKWQESLSDSIHGLEIRSKIQMIIKEIMDTNLSPEDSRWIMYEDIIRNIDK